MNASDLVAALCLPAAARVDKRVPKTLLAEHGARTAQDRRTLQAGVEECRWVASLKPTTIGVAAHQDAVREVLEVNVLRLVLRDGAAKSRLVELIHRAVPYPVALVTDEEHASFSLAHKRWSQAEGGKTVLDGPLYETTVSGGEHDGAFLAALALDALPQSSLHALYHGMLDALLARRAARRTGVFEVLPSAERAAARRAALEECARLEPAIARLRAAATRERQTARLVETNLELKRLEAALSAAHARL